MMFLSPPIEQLERPVLSGEEKGGQYSRLSLADRQAIVDILRETKQGLPAYFQPVTG